MVASEIQERREKLKREYKTKECQSKHREKPEFSCGNSERNRSK